jgi:hypothetical protein
MTWSDALDPLLPFAARTCASAVQRLLPVDAAKRTHAGGHEAAIGHRAGAGMSGRC